jgi:hypothetical protein
VKGGELVEKMKKTDTTFLTTDLKIRVKLMHLGHSFVTAVAEGNSELVKSICMEALKIKKEAQKLDFGK